MPKCMPVWCCMRKMDSKDDLDETEIYEIKREEQKVPEIVVTVPEYSQAQVVSTSTASEKINEGCEFMKVSPDTHNLQREEEMGIMTFTPTLKRTLSNKGILQNIDIDFEIPSLSSITRRLHLVNAALQIKAHGPNSPERQVTKQKAKLSPGKEQEQNVLKPGEFRPRDVRRRLAAFRPNATDDSKN